MNKITKVVNIYPSMPITGVNPPIRSTVKHVTKSINEIRTCLMSRAVVEEVLEDGTTIRLDNSNYNKVNSKSKCACAECNKSLTESGEKTPWQIAYEKALEGKSLTSMSRKQRRSAEAAARAAADAAVATHDPEVIIGVGTIETVEDSTEEVVNNVEEHVEVQEEIKTVDIEDPSAITVE